jgi:hypothetical protein
LETVSKGEPHWRSLFPDRDADRTPESGQPSWGAPKIREKLARLYPDVHTPAISTVHAVLDRYALVQRRMRRRNRATRRDRMRAKLQEIKAELRQRMHQTIPDQGHWLKQVVTGHFAYYAVPTNSRALSAFRHYVTNFWLCLGVQN